MSAVCISLNHPVEAKASACCKVPWSWSPVKDGLDLKRAMSLEPFVDVSPAVHLTSKCQFIVYDLYNPTACGKRAH